MRKGLVLLGLCSGLLVLSGCSTLGYLLQAGKGQLSLINHARPLAEWIKDERTPESLKRILSEADKIKQFGESQGLKPTANYTEYVELKRPYVVWIVSASEELSFKPKEWSFWMFGSFPYLGWFQLSDANDYAEQLRAKHLDVHVRGASAYSTLGWFKDPLLSSMIPQDKYGQYKDEAIGSVTDVLLHESVHATFYIKGQSFFDESLASFVAHELTLAYLKQTRGEHSQEYLAYVHQEERGERYFKIMNDAYLKLQAVYLQHQSSDDSKRQQKQKIIEKTQERLEQELDVKNKELNNAVFYQFKTYHSGFDEFQALYEGLGKDWKQFWAVIQTLNEKSFANEQDTEFPKVLRDLLSRHTPRQSNR